MRKFQGAVLSALAIASAAVLLGGCSAGGAASSGKSVKPDATVAAADTGSAEAAPQYPSGPDISKVNLCLWVSTALTDQNWGFGLEYPVGIGVQTFHHSGTVSSLSCEVTGTDTTQSAARVTLISGGEPVEGAPEQGVAKPYTYNEYAGQQANAEEPAAALVAVQLEKGLVLNVEGFREGRNQDMQNTLEAGASLLMGNLLGERDNGVVTDLPENVAEDARPFCDSLGLDKWADKLIGPDGEMPVTTASGQPNVTGRDLFGSPYSATRTCAVSDGVKVADIWPWNSPHRAERPRVTFTFYAYDSTSAAQAVVSNAKPEWLSSAHPQAFGPWVVTSERDLFAPKLSGTDLADFNKAVSGALTDMADVVASTPIPVEQVGD